MENIELGDGSAMVRISAEEMRAMTRDGSQICVVTTAQLEALAEQSAKKMLDQMERAKMAEDWLPMKTAAKLINLSLPTFKKIVDTGKIKFSLVKGRYLFKRRDIEVYMEGRVPGVCDIIPKEAEECAGR